MRELFVVMSVMAGGFLSIQSAHQLVHLCFERPGMEDVTMDMPVDMSQPEIQLARAPSQKSEAPYRSFCECEFELGSEFQVREPFEVQTPQSGLPDTAWKSLNLAAFPGKQALNSSRATSDVDLPMVQ